jgi:hypothetical protein
MLPKPEKQKQARVLRQQGLSIRAITKQLGVAKSSVVLWVKEIELTDEQKEALAGSSGRSQRKEEKRCPQCGTTDLAAFGINVSRWDGLQAYCKTCVNTYRKSKNKIYALRYRYGLNEGDYERIFQQQGGVCALCGEPPMKTPLVIDHDHATNKFRGLLHPRCNTLLGHAQDRVDVLMSAVRYLEKQLSTPV